MGQDRTVRRTMGRSATSGLSAEDLDMPVKRYSTGMMAHLGFAIATANDADVLLIDEVLAVGDAAFQRSVRPHPTRLKAKGLHHRFRLALPRQCRRS